MSPRFLWLSDLWTGNSHAVSREGKQKSAELDGGSATDTASKIKSEGPQALKHATNMQQVSLHTSEGSTFGKCYMHKPTPIQNHTHALKLSKLHQEQAGTYDWFAEIQRTMSNFTVMVMDHWHSLARKAVESPSTEIFQSHWWC